MTTPTFYQHPRCGTCVKARAWLSRNAIETSSFDLTAAVPTADEIRSFHQRSGQPIRRLLNTSGQSYRSGGFSERVASMSDEAIYEALAADGLLLKRPVLDAGDVVLIGFDEKQWSGALARR